MESESKLVGLFGIASVPLSAEQVMALVGLHPGINLLETSDNVEQSQDSAGEQCEQ